MGIQMAKRQKYNDDFKQEAVVDRTYSRERLGLHHQLRADRHRPFPRCRSGHQQRFRRRQEANSESFNP